MKRMCIWMVCILVLWGCADGSGGVMPDRGETAVAEEEPEETGAGMDDLMKITTWVMDPALEGKGYWAYAEDMKTYPHRGYWVSGEGEPAVPEEKVFREEQLQVGKVYTMAPLGYKMSNLELDFDFDGIVTVEKTDPADNSILLDFSDSVWNQWSGETVISRNGPCTLNVYPLGKKLSFEGVGGALVQPDVLAGKEYLLTVKGYELDGSLLVTAQIRLVSLEDEAYPYEEIMRSSTRGFGELFSVGENRTRFCSVELVSCAYSDQYKMMMTES